MTDATRKNPLLDGEYGTPHNTAPFDRLTLSDYEEAIMEGMRQEEAAIREITDNPEEPTFENTILPPTDELLNRATTIFFNLLSCCTSDEADKLAEKLSPLLTEHSNKILLNQKLFERIKFVKEHATGLTLEEQKVLDNAFDSFQRGGACLSEEDKKRLSQLRVELSGLTLQFSQNCLKETNAYSMHIKDRAQLAGLPDTALEAAALAAKQKGVEGWLFTLHQPSYGPFITYADNRELRRELYTAKNTICCKGGEHDNRRIVTRIVNLRREIAQLLGEDTYACHVLKRRMAETPSNVYAFIRQLEKAYMPKAKEDVTDVEALAKRLEGKDFVLEPWDYSYYGQKLKKERFALDSEMLRPYFRLEKVKEGIFGLATRLYGITFHRRKDIPVYHPDVEAYEVHDEDGSYLAILYADFYPRDNKQSGAWMTSYAEQYVDHEGKDHRPHVSITMNLTKPTEDKPSLLTLGEVETFLHEFGHALHGIFSRVRFMSLSGTNVYWDFVELPSQFMENYATQEQFLNTFAHHYQTDAPMPSELLQRVKDSTNFQCGYQCIRQLNFCQLDMAYYDRHEVFSEDVPAFEKKVWARTRLLPQLPETCMSVQFGHIMSGGYAAGYYSYKWAEVLDADAFSLFLQNGIFDHRTAARFRHEILERGGTEPPMRLYERFRGQKPTIDALLTRNGVKASATGASKEEGKGAPHTATTGQDEKSHNI